MESVHGRIRIDEDENDTHDLMSYPQHEQTMGEPSLHTESDHRQLRSEVKKVPLPQPQLRHLNLLAVRGIHYVEYAIGKPSQKVRLALSLNSDYAIFRCSQYVSTDSRVNCSKRIDLNSCSITILTNSISFVNRIAQTITVVSLHLTGSNQIHLIRSDAIRALLEEFVPTIGV